MQHKHGELPREFAYDLKTRNKRPNKFIWVEAAPQATLFRDFRVCEIASWVPAT